MGGDAMDDIDESDNEPEGMPAHFHFFFKQQYILNKRPNHKASGRYSQKQYNRERYSYPKNHQIAPIYGNNNTSTEQLH
jgi:hypothetical protein